MCQCLSQRGQGGLGVSVAGPRCDQGRVRSCKAKKSGRGLQGLGEPLKTCQRKVDVLFAEKSQGTRS